MTQSELVAQLKEEVKGLTSSLSADTDYENAIDDAERETEWTLPQTTNFRIFWLKERAKRHLLFYLLTESAKKFKIQDINLQHRFQHYRELIKMMDEQFLAIQESRPEEFANVDAFRMFGTKIDAGFEYEPLTGRDFTYDSDNVVIHKPDEND